MTMKKVRRRVDPEVRRQEILEAALLLAKRKGYTLITRGEVATEADVSTGLVTNYFNTMNQLKEAVMRLAIEREVLPIIAQGLSLKDKHALQISQSLKKRVLAYFG